MRKECLNSIYRIAQNDPKVIFVGSDLGAGTLDEMKFHLPGQFFMEGISEQHIAGMVAGLAMEGFTPFFNTIATFITRRCYEQIALDICLHNLPVRLIGNGGGLVYAPLGPTHLAVDDIALMRALPNMTVVAPCDSNEMSQLIDATEHWKGPIYIRLAKGQDKIISTNNDKFAIGKGFIIKPLLVDGVLLISTGVMTQVALKASESLSESGIECGVLHIPTIKPLDYMILMELLPMARKIITIEEHFRSGGLGSAILEFCNDHLPKLSTEILRIGIPDEYSHQYGSQKLQLESYGIDVNSIIKNIKNNDDT
jgi:transketolase